MYNYLEKYDDNFNNLFEKDLIEYEKYVKMFYNDNSKCPLDNKSDLDKKEENGKFILKCSAKGKEWKMEIEKPIIFNLFYRREELREKFNDKSLFFKNKLKEIVKDPLLKPDENKDIEKLLKELKDIEKEKDNLNGIFQKQQDFIDDIDKQKQDLIKKSLEHKIKREMLYEKLVKINGEIKMKLKEIYLNENIPDQKRLSEISKNVNLTLEETKNWILWFESVFNYIKTGNELEKLNDDLMVHQKTYERMNHKFVLEAPKISGEKPQESKTKKIKVSKKLI